MNFKALSIASFMINLIMIALFGILVFDLDDIYQNLDMQEKRISWIERYCEPGT